MSAFIALGDPASALAAYERPFPDSRAGRDTRVLHARLLLIAGRLAEAREELAVLLAEEPSDPEVLYQLSVLEGLEGNRDARKELLQKVVSVEPGRADALASLGDLALEEKDSEAADSFYRDALAADPGNLVALLGTAESLSRRKDFEGAAAAAGRAVEAQPDYPFAYVDRARARRALGDHAGAIVDLSRAIALDPSYPWSYIDRGRLYICRGAESRQLSRTSAWRSRLLLRSSRAGRTGPSCSTEAGRDREAVADWERVVSLRPDYWYAYPALGELDFLLGDWPQSRDSFAKAARFEEEAHSSLLLAALAARRGGDAGGAAALIEPALQAIPRESWEWDVARFLLKPERTCRW